MNLQCITIINRNMKIVEVSRLHAYKLSLLEHINADCNDMFIILVSCVCPNYYTCTQAPSVHFDSEFVK